MISYIQAYRNGPHPSHTCEDRMKKPQKMKKRLAVGARPAVRGGHGEESAVKRGVR